MARTRREPTIEARRHCCADGSVTEMWSVRYYDATGARRRLRCASREEADFERARIVLAESRGEPLATSGEPVAVDESGLTLAQFWPMYRADAAGRPERSTMREYARLWERRLEPRFGHVALDAIRPRMVSQWRAEMLAAGVGAEAVRYAMVLLQAMFTLAIEWGEAQANPVSVVRKPRQGRQPGLERRAVYGSRVAAQEVGRFVVLDVQPHARIAHPLACGLRTAASRRGPARRSASHVAAARSPVEADASAASATVG
jgi:Phage integrase, N-terminal SAM-like domain